MSLFERYKSTPETIDAQRAAAIHDSTALVGVRNQVVIDRVKAASGLGGLLAIPAAHSDPAFVAADEAAKLKLIASASLLQWAEGVRHYDTGIDALNREYDAAAATGFGVDADRYYEHGTQTPEQRDAAYHHAVSGAQAALIARLTREKAVLDAALDDAASAAKATLTTDPSDANLNRLFQAGLFPLQASLDFSAIDVSKVDLALLVANMKALGLLPPGVDAAQLTRIQSLVAGLGSDIFTDQQSMAQVLELLKGLDPQAVELLIATLPPGSLDKWNTAMGDGGLGLSTEDKIALANLVLKGLTPAEVRRFMSSMTNLQPGFDGVIKDGSWTWLAEELGADSASLDQINQGNAGDCWFIASIGAELQQNPDFVSEHMVDNGNGTYTVTFYDDGEPVEITVDGEIPTRNGGSDSTGSHTNPDWSTDGPLWLAIYEKAYASFKGDYHAIEGGYGDEGMSDLTGRDAERTSPGDGVFGGGMSLDDIQQELAAHHPVTVGTTDDSGFWPWQDDDDDLVDDQQLVSHHEYIVQEVNSMPDGTKQIVLTNPWGPNGSAPYHVTLTESAYEQWINEVSVGG